MKYNQKNIVTILLISLLSVALASCSPGQTSDVPTLTKTTASIAYAPSTRSH